MNQQISFKFTTVSQVDVAKSIDELKSKHTLEGVSNPRPLVTQLSGTGDPGQRDHRGIPTHDLLIKSRML